MTASTDFERRVADFYAADPLSRAPDWVLRSALEAIEDAPQQRNTGVSRWGRHQARRASWLAAAAAVVVAVGGIGLVVAQLGQAPDVDTASPSPTPSPAFAAEFRRPFRYDLPTRPGFPGGAWVVGPTGPTSWEFLIPNSEGPNWAAVGVVVLAINGGRVDPCAENSHAIPIPGGPHAVVDYLKTVPRLLISGEAETTVSGLPAVRADMSVLDPTSACPILRPFAPQEGVDEAEDLVGRTNRARVTAVDVDGAQVVIWTWRHGYSTQWYDVADDVIRSIRFDPAAAGPEGSSGTTPVAELRLTESFTSATHGLSIGHPAGWSIRRATQPWTADRLPLESPDVIDRIGTDDMFVLAASQPLRFRTGEEWWEWLENDSITGSQCRSATRTLPIDATPGRLVVRCPSGTPVAYAWIDERGYFLEGHGLPSVATFREILDTVELHPEAAFDDESGD